MAELRQINYQFAERHAQKLRFVAKRIAKRKKACSEDIEVALMLHDLAKRIDDVFRSPVKLKVVPFKPRGPQPPSAA